MSKPVCLLHLGQPKTGTTSIQESLFWGLEDPRFRLVSLDCEFGNTVVDCAFQDRLEDRHTFFTDSIPRQRLSLMAARSRDYLDRALRAAGRAGVTPVISAEIAFWKEAAPAENLQRFVTERGFEPRIICYLRPYFDMLESRMQQAVRIVRRPWDRLKRMHAEFSEPVVLSNFDRIFGREQVDVFLFDPKSFPERCVVRHFCQATGIPLDPGRIVRSNESLNRNAMQFVFVFNRQAPPGGGYSRTWFRFRQSVLVQALSTLPGAPFRLHPSVHELSRPLLEPHLPWLEERLGQPFPLTLARRLPDDGIREERQLLDFDRAALDWLAERTGSRPITASSGPEAEQQVVQQLNRLVRQSWREALSLARDRGRLLWQRRRLRQQILR